jgi:ParB family chromosome partitioning protein
VPDAEVSFHILALNTEKAHNLKEKSLEVIRPWWRCCFVRGRRTASAEEDFGVSQLESPHLITLGLLPTKTETSAFAGAELFAPPILKAVDRSS